MAATDERAIHEFPTGTIDDNSLLIMDRPTSSPGEYETEKFAIVNLGLKLLGGIDFPSNLDTEEQDIFGAINEVNSKAMNIADEYDETASYSKGDYCIYQNASYRCIKASGTTTGTFVAADWTQIKVLTEVKANTEEISSKQDATDNILTTTDKTVVGAINELNSGKVNTTSFTPYTETTITLTRAEGIPLTVPLIGVLRSGKVCILAFAHELPARTYAQGEVIWKVNPPPKGQVFSIVALGSAHPSITVLTNGDVRFNGSQTLSQATYIIGQLVYLCN